MVAPERSTSGQNPDTEKRGTIATLARAIIAVTTVTAIAFKWNRGSGDQITSSSLKPWLSTALQPMLQGTLCGSMQPFDAPVVPDV